MTVPVDLQMTHVGLYVFDVDVMARFYGELLGMVETDRGVAQNKHDIRFLTRSPHEHHQLVLASGRPRDASFSIVNQLSFRVADVEGMRRMYQHVQSHGVTVARAVTHGNAWSMYFNDPEGNGVEIYTPSQWYVAQPFAQPVDFTKPAAELIADNERLLEQYSGVVTRSSWSDALARRIAEASAPA